MGEFSDCRLNELAFYFSLYVLRYRFGMLLHSMPRDGRTVPCSLNVPRQSRKGPPVLLRLGVCVTKRRGFYCKLKSITITVRLDPQASPLPSANSSTHFALNIMKKSTTTRRNKMPNKFMIECPVYINLWLRVAQII